VSSSAPYPGKDKQPRATIWNRPVRGSRGPAPGHSRAAIVAAAVSLADADGLAAVSMRAVGAALGTGAGSLYRYLSSRDDLLDLMTDAVLDELAPYPDAGDWLAGMVQLAERQAALYRRHPWLQDLLQRPAAPGPNTFGYLEACLRIMEPLPCGTTRKLEAVGIMTGAVALFAGGGTRTVPYVMYGLDAERHPYLMAALREAPPATAADDLFDRTIRALLTGLLTPA
jgi:AcrR family transcriptional regulator